MNIKSFFTLFSISFSILSVAGLPTTNQDKLYNEVMKDSSDPTQIINDYNNGVSLFYFYGNNMEIVPSKNGSVISRGIINILSVENENRQFINEYNLLFNKLRPRLDFDLKYGEITLIEAIVSNCVEDQMEYYLQNYKTKHPIAFAIGSMNAAMNFPVGDSRTDTCDRVSLMALNTVNKLVKPSPEDIRDLFDSNGGTGKTLNKGPLFADTASVVINELNKLVRFKPSQKPESSEPDDNWYYQKFGVLSSNLWSSIYSNPDKIWGSFNDYDKEWFCYYSTLDEFFEAIKSIGFSDKDLETYYFGFQSARFNHFIVTDIFPYCKNLKN